MDTKQWKNKNFNIYMILTKKLFRFLRSFVWELTCLHLKLIEPRLNVTYDTLHECGISMYNIAMEEKHKLISVFLKCKNRDTLLRCPDSIIWCKQTSRLTDFVIVIKNSSTNLIEIFFIPFKLQFPGTFGEKH